MNATHIYLVGLKHSGKTQHGKALARALGRSFHDTDSLIQELDATEDGMRRLVRDIFLEDGEQRFQQLEAAACRLAADYDGEIVVATGGGICDNHDALDAIRGGLLVYLEESEEALARRIFRGSIPAFLHTEDEAVARERFHELYERRSAAYQLLAALSIDVRQMSLSEAQQTIIARVQEHLNGGK